MNTAWPARYGVTLEGRETLAEIPALAQAAEAAGAGTFWVASHLYLRDPITLAHVALQATQRIRVALMAICEKDQVPCGPVYSIDEIFEDAQYAHRENILTMKDPRVGELAIPNLVPRLTDTPGRVKWLGPSMGEHNDEVYRDWLKLDQAEIDRLTALQVI
jgi:succinyl-CoA:(S)-malate CoA-transferase subunit B